MKAVLLAAGVGTRLRPITNTKPKCLVEINGVPLLDIWLSQLSKHPNIEHIYINTHYLSDVVELHLKTNWSAMNNLSTWYEPELLGTAGTLAHHADELAGSEVLLIHADNLSLFSLDEFIECHLARLKHTVMTMMLFRTDQPQQCGIVEVDEHGVLTKMHEKVKNPPSDLANGAVYILSNVLVQSIKHAGVKDFSNEVIPAYYGRINCWINTHYHRDIGTPESLSKANQEYKTLIRKLECN